MTPKELLYGVIGAVIGAVGTYFVTEYMHDKEITAIYADLNDEREEMDELVAEYDGGPMGGEVVDLLDREHPRKRAHLEEPEILWRDHIRYILEDGEMRECPLEDGADPEEESDSEASTDVTPPLRGIINLPVSSSEVISVMMEDEEVEEGEGDELPDPIFVISNDQVQAGSQVVLTYIRDDGSAEVGRLMSVDTPGFDDIIETDALHTLIGDEAYGILRRSRSRKDPNDTRLVCVRNNVLNLDFAISY